MSGFKKDHFDWIVAPLLGMGGELVESLDWSAALAPKIFPEGSELVLDEGKSMTVHLGSGLHHGRKALSLAAPLPTY
jgi:hypothetical protein